MILRLKSLTVLGALAALHAQGSGAHKCAPLTADGRHEIVQYVGKLAKFADPKGFNITGESFEEGTCYRRLELSATGGDSIVLYLSPDQQFIFPRVFDLRVDPAAAATAEIARVNAEIARYIDQHGTPTLGPADGPITIAIFSDLQCPFCRQAMDILTKNIAESETHRIRIAYLHYPLPSHPWARAAAESLACLNGRSAFWEMSKFVFDHQSEISPDNLGTRLKDRLGMQVNGEGDLQSFTACVESRAKARYVDGNIALGQRLGVQGTPTLFINGRRVLGLKSASDLQRLTTVDVVSRAE